MATELTDEEISALKVLVDLFDLEEQNVRYRQIRLWKKLEMYWAGFTKIWWSDTAHDWRTWDNSTAGDDVTTNGYYDKDINVYRAFLETVIASLSSTVPPVYCLPDDADNTLDCETAKAGTRLSELMYRHIDAPLLWVRALWVYCTQGMVAAYNYTDEDEKYGTVETDEYKNVTEEVETKICPNCQMELAGPELAAAMGLMEDEEDEYDPGQDDVVIQNVDNSGQVLCTQCQMLVDPELQKNKVVVKRFVGKTNQPKARQCVEINGGLFVKIPNWARSQSDCPYLCYEYETHFTNVYAKYPFLREKLAGGQDNRISGSYTGGNNAYERWGRLSPQYFDEYPIGTPTCRNWWFRPSAFEGISDDELREKIKEKFPFGCKAVWVNDQFAEACPEKLDDHWTITKNPLSEYVHFDPLGLLLVSIQDITTELISLTLQTIEHGVPQTFADPSVLDFEAYRNTEVVVGGIYPAKGRAGKEVKDAFFMTSTASLGPEVKPFGDKINELGQFVSGALPTLFGGDTGPNSRTAAQQSMSKNAALQRLQTTWKMINVLWKNMFGKMIPAYIKSMLEDEKFAIKEFDSYVNVVIRRAQLDGKIGSVEVDASDDLPFSIGQVRDLLMNLLNQGNPLILQEIFTPENLPLLAKALGLQDLHLTNEQDREKQYEEIQLLINQVPIQGAPSLDQASGQVMPAMEMPSIMPEQDVDNHGIEMETCRYWLVGAAGRLAKIERPDGYKNVLLHMKMHQMFMQAQMMQQVQQQQAMQPDQQANKEGQQDGGTIQ